MINKLQTYLSLKENRTFFVDTVDGAANELNSILLKIHNFLKIINSENDDEIKNHQGIEKVAINILELLQDSQFVYDNFFQIFECAYTNWTTEIFNSNNNSTHNIKKELVVEINSDEDSELEIVNVVKYINPEVKKTTTQNDSWITIEKDNIHQPSTSAVKKTQINIASTKERLLQEKQELTESRVGEVEIEKPDANKIETAESDADEIFESSADEVDHKLNLKCVVLINRLSKQDIDIYKNVTVEYKRKRMSDEEFERLINIDFLENKKRRHSLLVFSETSDDDSQSSFSNKNKIKRKRAKLSIDNDISDVSSVYETSDSDTCSDMDSIFQSSNLRENEEDEIKNKLIKKLVNDEDSSEVDSSQDESESDGSEYEEIKKTKNELDMIKKMKKENMQDYKSIYNGVYKKRAWTNDSLLNFTLDDSSRNQKEKEVYILNDNDKEISEKQVNKNKSKKSEHNFNESSERSDTSSDSGNGTVKKRKKKRRIVSRRSSEESSTSSTSSTFSAENSACGEESDDCQLISSISQKPIELTVLKQAKTPGRKNIRSIFDDDKVLITTKKAGRDEETRIQRLNDLEEKRKALTINNKGDEELLVLEFDLHTKKELLIVDPGLVRYLKPHQKDGVKFMWNSCFETLERTKNTVGSGCILGHNMGLGKTLQVITLVHTLLSNKDLGIRTVLVVCPKNVILNWVDEFEIWLQKVEKKTTINIYELTQKTNFECRMTDINLWHQSGGVLIMSYSMFRNFSTKHEKFSREQVQNIENCILDPGADVVVCDEGHLLKNENSLIANQMQKIKSKRRIVLTGTPLQNNLNEYHCMVQFIKPNLLGSVKEFRNRFVNPITNGHHNDSTDHDVQVMKKRAHVLHTMLKGCVQRCDYEVLTPYLPKKQEYVISIKLSPLQTYLYNFYVEQVIGSKSALGVLKCYNEIKKLIAHPKSLFLNTIEKNKSLNKKSTMQNVLDSFKSTKENNNVVSNIPESWWCKFITDDHLKDFTISYKMNLLFKIILKCEQVKDKLLVFSRSLQVLDTIQSYLPMFGQWELNKDFFRLDGKVNIQTRNEKCKKFNDPANRARLFLISTEAGALGINLTGANRVVIFDPSWNPSSDVQSIFRVFRFGQKKPCFVYRLIGAGSMEEKIYNRQVNKLSLSLRVVDEQQIERHFTAHELSELYPLKPLEEKVLIFPKDNLLAEICAEYKDQIYDLFEHDSLLQNKEDEELSEEDRKQAWEDFNREKLEAQEEGEKRKRTNQSKDYNPDTNSTPSLNPAEESTLKKDNCSNPEESES